jgi:hypothetical protein
VLREVALRQKPETCALDMFDNDRQARDATAHHTEQWLAAVDLALKTRNTTFAFVPADKIFAPDGWLTALRARGYNVEEPHSTHRDNDAHASNLRSGRSRCAWKEQDGKPCYTQTSKPIPGRLTYFCAKGVPITLSSPDWELEMLRRNRSVLSLIIPANRKLMMIA